MSTISLKTTPKIDALVRAQAAKAKISLSEWIRQAVIAHAQHGTTNTNTSSAHDLASDLCGVFADGPSDLSTSNLASDPRWMDRFGTD